MPDCDPVSSSAGFSWTHRLPQVTLKLYLFDTLKLYLFDSLMLYLFNTLKVFLFDTLKLFLFDTRKLYLLHLSFTFWYT